MIDTMKKVKRQPTEWKKRCAKQIDLIRDLYSDYVEKLKLYNKNTNLEKGKGLEYVISLKAMQMAKKYMKKMLYITHHQGNSTVGPQKMNWNYCMT